jgi:uncharacterized protein (TIGR04255 family)
MKLPKKISPDNIREAVVEVRYISDLSFELLVGIFFAALDESYTYTNIPPRNSAISGPVVVNERNEITFQVGVASLFYNDKITIKLAPNMLVFSCLNKYIGWEDYRPEIEKALIQIMATNHVTKCTRVGVRYISDYAQMDLRDCTKFSFKFGLPAIESDTVAFHSEFLYNGIKVILNLNNKVPYSKLNPSTKRFEIVKTSVVDIDVIADNLEVARVEEVLKVIEDNHLKEKEIFFGMLNDEFLNSLNPQY